MFFVLYLLYRNQIIIKTSNVMTTKENILKELKSTKKYTKDQIASYVCLFRKMDHGVCMWLQRYRLLFIIEEELKTEKDIEKLIEFINKSREV